MGITNITSSSIDLLSISVCVWLGTRDYTHCQCNPIFNMRIPTGKKKHSGKANIKCALYHWDSHHRGFHLCLSGKRTMKNKNNH